jgi:hypothetical protein
MVAAVAFSSVLVATNWSQNAMMMCNAAKYTFDPLPIFILQEIYYWS